MRRSNVELSASAEVETTTGTCEVTGQTYFGVEVPGLGELWSFDRDALADWLTAAAAEVAMVRGPEVVEP